MLCGPLSAEGQHQSSCLDNPASRKPQNTSCNSVAAHPAAALTNPKPVGDVPCIRGAIAMSLQPMSAAAGRVELLTSGSCLQPEHVCNVEVLVNVPVACGSTVPAATLKAACPGYGTAAGRKAMWGWPSTPLPLYVKDAYTIAPESGWGVIRPTAVSLAACVSGSCSYLSSSFVKWTFVRRLLLLYYCLVPSAPALVNRLAMGGAVSRGHYP